MWTINRHAWLLLLALMTPGAIMTIYGLTHPKARTEDGVSFVSFGLIWVGIMAVLEGGLFVYLWQQKRNVAYFMEKGVRGFATILNAETTGMELNNMPEVELYLDIVIPNHPPYTITHKSCWNLLSLGTLRRGARLEVLVDPKNHKKILIVV